MVSLTGAPALYQQFVPVSLVAPEHLLAAAAGGLNTAAPWPASFFTTSGWPHPQVSSGLFQTADNNAAILMQSPIQAAATQMGRGHFLGHTKATVAVQPTVQHVGHHTQQHVTCNPLVSYLSNITYSQTSL